MVAYQDVRIDNKGTGTLTAHGNTYIQIYDMSNSKYYNGYFGKVYAYNGSELKEIS